MSGLTAFGVLHTAISLVAVASGAMSFVRDKRISPENHFGKTYLATTALTSLTGLAIYHHGGFGPPHALSIATLLLLGVGVAAAWTRWFGRASAYVETISLSATFFFHMIPVISESLTRLPVNAPLAASPESPLIQSLILASLALFIVGVVLQVRRLRAASHAESRSNLIPAVQ